MTVIIGPTVRLTRETLEAASSAERAELLEERKRQVEAARELHGLRLARPTYQPSAGPVEPEARPLPRRKKARSRQVALRKLRELEGAWRPGLVDVSRAKEYLQQLHQMGYSAAVLAVLTGVDHAQVLRLLKDEDSQRWIGRERERQILDAEFDLDQIPDTCLIPSWPTRRRIQALMAIGWSRQAIADRAGVSRQAVASSLGRDEVSARAARRYRQIYADLEDTPGPHKRSSSIARDRGWPPPSAWDNIDNLAEQPDPSRWVEEADLGSARRRVRLDDLEDFAEWGMTVPEGADRLGVTKDAVEACARRASRGDLLDRMRTNGCSNVAWHKAVV